MKEDVKAFISYTHDSEEHRQWVLELANKLTIEGIEVLFDRYIKHEAPEEGWPAWMDNTLAISDFVLVVCTENYLDRFEGREKPNVGLGAKFESLLIKADIYLGNSTNRKFLPVLRNASDLSFIPRMLKSHSRYVLYDDYDSFYRRITDQPYIIRPEKGAVIPRPNNTKLNIGKALEMTQSHIFSIQGLSAEYILVDGTGRDIFKRSNIHCFLDANSVELPEDLNTIRSEIELNQSLAQKSNEPFFWNGNILGLKSFRRSRANAQEELALYLRFYSTDYYTYLATSMSLDKTVSDQAGNAVTVREKYLSNTSWDEVVPLLASGFGVAMSVITKDGYMLVAKRGRSGVGPWQEHFNTPINEGLSADLDLDTSGVPDLFLTAKRGALEELNIEIKTSSINFLTFGFETINYQWGLHGMVEVEFTAETLLEKTSSGAKDKWESGNLYTIKFEVAEVVRFVIQNGPWTPFGKVCIICTLINHFGRSAVEKEISSQMGN